MIIQLCTLTPSKYISDKYHQLADKSMHASGCTAVQCGVQCLLYSAVYTVQFYAVQLYTALYSCTIYSCVHCAVIAASFVRCAKCIVSPHDSIDYHEYCAFICLSQDRTDKSVNNY